MSTINEMAQIPDEALDSIIGGVLTEEVREQVRIITQQLKRIDISYKNAVEWWYQHGEKVGEKGPGPFSPTLLSRHSYGLGSLFPSSTHIKGLGEVVGKERNVHVVSVFAFALIRESHDAVQEGVRLFFITVKNAL